MRGTPLPSSLKKMLFLRPQVLSLTAFHKFHTTPHPQVSPTTNEQTGDKVMKAQGLSLGGAACLVLHPEFSASILPSWHSRFCATSVSFSQPIFTYVLRSSINTYLLVHICWCILTLPSLPPSCPPVCTTLLDDLLRDVFPNRWAHK